MLFEATSIKSFWEITSVVISSPYKNSLSSLSQLLSDPEWIASQIQNGINVDYVVFHLIIDAEWKSLRQHSMESKVGRMNTGKKN